MKIQLTWFAAKVIVMVSIREVGYFGGVRDRVNTLNKTLKSVSDERNILIHPRCKELIQDLRQVRWRRDAAGNPTVDLDKTDAQRTHVSDALSYLVAQEWGLRPHAVVGKGFIQ